MSAREVDVAGIPTRALRVSYVGELGWELHHPIAEMPRLYDALHSLEVDYGLTDFGMYAANSLRMEKAFRAWGFELTTEVTLFEAGMDRFVAVDKGDFTGRQALLAHRREGPRWKLVYLAMEEGDADPLGNEPVYVGTRLVGITTSGAYGYFVRASLSFAYVEPSFATADADTSRIVILWRARFRRLEGSRDEPSV